MTTLSTFDIGAGLSGFYSGAFARLSGAREFGAPIALEQDRKLTYPHRKGIDTMELQNSMTPLADLTLPLLGIWNGLKDTADDSEDLFDSEHTVAPPSNIRTLAARGLANETASFDGELSADDKIPAPQLNNYALASDDQLLAAAKASDGQAFEELSNRYLRAMRKRVYSIVRNPEDTEDVVQDSLLKAYRHLQNFRESCEFSQWITRIAINTALMLLRKRKSRREVSFDQTGDDDKTWFMWDIPDPSPNTERTYARKETLEFVSRAVNRLPSLHRSVLEQYHAHGLSLRDAADKLGITVASAKSRLFRARRSLRARLEQQQISVSDACY